MQTLDRLSLVRLRTLVFAVCVLGLAMTSFAQAKTMAARKTIADPSAPAVTLENLDASERFWPYMLSITEAFETPSGRTLNAGTKGVLIRVEDGTAARIDFGRDGRARVPVAASDLVARANAIRLGTEPKNLPNLTWAIGARMVDPTGDTVGTYEIEHVIPSRGFLTVFVDPADEVLFATMAKALSPLNGRHDVMTVIFPQGGASDASLLAKEKALGWEAPFVLRHLSGPYAATLLPDGAEPPYVMLQSNEGRVIVHGPWSDALAKQLESALEENFGPGSVATR